MLPALREAQDRSRSCRPSWCLHPATPTPLDYVMRQGEKGRRAVDVLLDGSISRVAVQRSDFRSLLHRTAMRRR